VIGGSVFNFIKLISPKYERIVLASSLLHELGHTLGIAPYTIEGCDNISLFSLRSIIPYIKEWRNYQSVMNYLYILHPRIVDFSEGSNHENDQNDWANFYLPFFQIENNIICEPGIVPPVKDRVVHENKSLILMNWTYNQTLSNIIDDLPIRFSGNNLVEYTWQIFTQNNSEHTEYPKKIKVYCKPNVPITDWSLISEGFLYDNGDIQLNYLNN
jgi:hypothetical protein